MKTKIRKNKSKFIGKMLFIDEEEREENIYDHLMDFSLIYRFCFIILFWDVIDTLGFFYMI